jgi:hypothetical protein
VTNYWQKRAYAELSTEASDLSKRGFVYLMAEFFTVGATSSVHFVMETGTKSVQFEFYDIGTDTATIRAQLIEGATYTKFGTPITPRNLNRTHPDASSIVLSSASAISGGVKIASELVGSGNKAGGDMSSNKVHVLKESQGYVMSFFNPSNQPTLAHMNLGWSEDEPPQYDLVTKGINSGGVT